MASFRAYTCCLASGRRIVCATRRGTPRQRRMLSSGADTKPQQARARRPLLDVSKWAAGVSWLEPGAAGNPYPVPILDVSPFTSTRRAHSSDPAVVAAFKESRRTTSPGDARAEFKVGTTCVRPRDVLQGRELVYYLPFSADRLPRGATAEQVADAMDGRQGPVRLAVGMEDKWDLYQGREQLWDVSGEAGDMASTSGSPMLYFTHSWLRTVLLAARLERITVVEAPFAPAVEAALAPAMAFASQSARANNAAMEAAAAKSGQSQPTEAFKGFDGAFRVAVSAVYTAPDELEADGGQWTMGTVDFLMKTLFMGTPAPHPLPPHMHEDQSRLQHTAMDVAVASFQLFGRAATAASFDDTTTVLPFTAPPPVVMARRTPMPGAKPSMAAAAHGRASA